MALVPDVLDLIRRQVKRFAELLTDDAEQQTLIRSLWREVARPKTIGSSTDDKTMCLHILTTGPNIGSLCGKKVSPSSHTGRYCTTHATARETLDDPHQTKLPFVKPKQDVVEKAALVALTKIAGCLVNQTTRLAFDHRKMAVGKEVDGKIVPLAPEDVDFCLKQRIPFCQQEPTGNISQ